MNIIQIISTIIFWGLWVTILGSFVIWLISDLAGVAVMPIKKLGNVYTSLLGVMIFCALTNYMLEQNQ